MGLGYLHFGQICFAGLRRSQTNITPATIKRGQKNIEIIITARRRIHGAQLDP